MALVVICGIPASGKSTLAQLLVRQLQSRLPVTVIDEPSLHLDRRHSFQDAAAEKRVRSQLKSAVERALSKDRTVILDSLNSIKGYRYEVWCLARAAGIKYCLVHCDTSEGQAHEWNQERHDQAYSQSTVSDLIGRFETPDSRNRWEQPLFRVRLDAPDLHDTLLAISSSLIDGRRNFQEQPVRQLQPTSATTNPALSKTNLLAELDRAAQSAIDTILEAQGAANAMGAETRFELGGTARPASLPRRVSLPEMRRHKRNFLKLVTQNSYSSMQHAEDGQEMFLKFLQTAMEND